MDMIELAQRFVDSVEFQTVYGGKPTKKEREERKAKKVKKGIKKGTLTLFRKKKKERDTHFVS
jgi:hypothetical protein